MMDSVPIGYMKMTHLQTNSGKRQYPAAKPLSPNGVSQFLSSKVTQIVTFGGFPQVDAKKESGVKSFNSLKNWIKLCFSESLAENGTGIAL